MFSAPQARCLPSPFRTIHQYHKNRESNAHITQARTRKCAEERWPYNAVHAHRRHDEHCRHLSATASPVLGIGRLHHEQRVQYVPEPLHVAHGGCSVPSVGGRAPRGGGQRLGAQDQDEGSHAVLQ